MEIYIQVRIQVSMIDSTTLTMIKFEVGLDKLNCVKAEAWPIKYGFTCNNFVAIARDPPTQLQLVSEIDRV